MGDFPTRILLAIDGSEGADLAASRAADLARRTDSELHVVCVGFAPAFLIGEPGRVGYDRMLLEEIEDEARELLRKLSWRVKVAGGDVAGAHLGMGEERREATQDLNLYLARARAQKSPPTGKSHCRTWRLWPYPSTR
jgi:nucleotide-binding universal stress UspA family protein